MSSMSATAVKLVSTYSYQPLIAVNPVTVEPLINEHENEVLAFLAARPIHTVCMAGFIRDNGIVSPLNRGTFYGCRDAAGQLEGVALIGHATLVETRTDRALEEFARLAQKCNNTHMIMGEQERIDEFWNHYSEDGQAMRLACRELLYELRCPVDVREEVEGLRPATLDDLELIVPVHAQMAFEESGVNPLEKDPEGFRRRCARRVEQGRTWVWIEGGKLKFKADIISETPEVIYLEGIWVDPEERGKGYGARCLSQVSRKLLTRTHSVCLLVNEQNKAAHRFYQKVGYKFQSYYDTIFLNNRNK